MQMKNWRKLTQNLTQNIIFFLIEKSKLKFGF